MMAMQRFCLCITAFFALHGRMSSNSDHLHSLQSEDRVLVVSTIDGNLTALSWKTGEIKWTLDEAPVLKVPLSVTNGYFLPDPRDGTLYILNKNKLKKLPLTIPQLVQASPCRTADGIMYAGRKHDVWFSLNPETGQKIDSLSNEGSEKICPAVAAQHSIYVGRTEYSLTMFDEKSRSKKWNASFIDYSSQIFPSDLDYGYNFYSSTIGGRLVTVDSVTGDIVWKVKFDTLVVAVYSLESSGLHRLPLTILGQKTLDNLLTSVDFENNASQQDHHQQQWKFLFNKRHEKVSLYPALYVGEFENGLYAMPSLVDESTITFVPQSREPPLLPGPFDSSPQAKSSDDASGQKFLPINYDVAKLFTADDFNDILFFGYHKMPDSIESMNLYSSHKVQHQKHHLTLISSPLNVIQQTGSVQNSRLLIDNGSNLDGSHSNFFYERILLSDFAKIVVTSLVTGSFIVIVMVFCLRKLIIKSVILHSQSMQVSPSASLGSAQFSASESDFSKSHSNSNGHNSLNSDLLFFRVGKISFNTQNILGRGCEGTVVYKGTFDGRDVAVKRVVSDFFNLADREVDLLRASDSHPNVIRYFCMESDSQFRYIALELCWATLNDYVESEDVQEKCPLGVIPILEQATIGLSHLHSLKIVHRDIKPHNILLSQPNLNGRVNVLISDFGLCKKLSAGRNSFSKRSGFTGTDGWIAPEMLSPNVNSTFAVDIFSLGCVFYYVLSKGKHPFGDSFRRQANIAAGVYDVTDVKHEKAETCRHLIKLMIEYNPNHRPCVKVVLKHPVFWTNAKILTFFQDISDRVDKEDVQSLVVQTLEKGAWYVVNRDWRKQIHDGLLTDLKTRRTYRGNSVRDLLRALRNKKNHFRELPDDIKAVVGTVPEDLVAYFVDKFPHLLTHVYDALRVCQDEPVFRQYYEPA